MNINKLTKSRYRKYYNPHRWSLKHVVNKLAGLIKKTENTKRADSPKDWYTIRMKREINQIKKHIIFMEMLIDDYEKMSPREKLSSKYE